MDNKTTIEENMKQVAQEFKDNQKAFIAMGDETRQQIICAILQSSCDGIRVGEITKKTYISRPAVSHHLQILKEAGIVCMRKEGTKNFYYINSDEHQWRQMHDFAEHIYFLATRSSEYPRHLEDAE